MVGDALQWCNRGKYREKRSSAAQHQQSTVFTYLDQVRLQHQRISFTRGEDELDMRGLFQHYLYPTAWHMCRQVGLHAVSQLDSLANIQNLAVCIFPKVDTRRAGNMFCFNGAVSVDRYCCGWQRTESIR